MSAEEKAFELVDTYKFVLLSEDTQCGEEILCTGIAKRCALIAVEFAIEFAGGDMNEQFDKILYLVEVKQEIEKL
jgi:hypothetical protein